MKPNIPRIEKAVFRGNCIGYYVFETQEKIDAEALTARFTTVFFELSLPILSATASDDLCSDTYIYAVPFPLVDGDTCNLHIAEHVITLSATKLKWLSRVNYRVKPKLAKAAEHLVQRFESEMPVIKPAGVFPYDERYLVYRAVISNPCDAGFDGRWHVYVDGIDETQDSIVLQDALTKRADGDTRKITISHKVDRSTRNVIFSIQDAASRYPGFAIGVIPAERDSQLNGFYHLTQDAKADPCYARWFSKHRVLPRNLSEQKRACFDNEPVISIVIPVFNPPLRYLQEAVESVEAQTYGSWELILVNACPGNREVARYLDKLTDERIKVLLLTKNKGIAGNTNEGIRASKGDYISFLDQDDLLEPDALYQYVSTINRFPHADLLYCDEDSFTEKHCEPFSPLLKPDFCLDLLYSHNYIVHFLMVSRWLVQRIELSPDTVNGAQDYDLTLKASENARYIAHIPRVLYHWRQHEASSNAGNASAKPYAINAGVEALSSHFKRRGISAVVSPSDDPYVYRVSYGIPNNEPLVSIIIPNKDHVDYLQPCVTSILKKAGYTNYELIIAENNSEREETFSYYDILDQLDNRVRIITYNGTFNYSKIINYAASKANGEYYLFLNNDTQALTENFLDTMLGYFNRPEVGVLGPLLLYPDGLIQHAGLALMKSQHLGFMNQNHTLADNKGYLGSAACGFNYSAVLGACQMTSKAIFEEAGGYCEDLAVTYNDVDYCWKVREKDKLVVYSPSVKFFHKEYGSRGVDTADEERMLQTEKEAGIMRERWPRYFALGDPCINTNCDKDSQYFKLGDD